MVLLDVSIDLSALSGISENTFISGSTLVGTDYTLERNDGVNITTDFKPLVNTKLNITTFDSYTANTTDNVVTGATLVGTTLSLERNNGLLDVSVDLGSLTGGTGGGGNITTGNILWVDSVFGDDATALTNRQDKPYLTIEQSLSDSTNGDTIIVRPGEYDEEDLVVPSNVSLVSEGGWEVTIIGKSPATATRNIVELNENSFIDGFSVNVPQGSFSGIISSNSSGKSTANNITFYGNGGVGSTGTGLIKRGGGKLIGYSIRVEGGGMGNCFKVDSGTLDLEGVHVPQSNGDIGNVLLVTTSGGTNAGRAEISWFDCGNTNVTNAIRTEGGSSGVIPVVKIFTPNISNVTNAVSAEGDYEEINLLGGLLENITYAVKVDLTGNGVEAKYRITSNHQPNYIYPPAVAYTAEFGLDFQQESTEEFNSSKNVFGVPQMSLGFAEKGTQLSVGRGAPTTVGMKVLTTDNTASSVSDGGNLIDITDDAKSKEGSTVTFQTGGTNTTILFTTQRVSNDLTTPLKFYGLYLKILQKKSGGDYVFDYWDGSEWVEDRVHIHSSDLGYSYGNELFLRSQSEEDITFNLSKDSWSSKTIDGTNGFWMRCRTVSSGSTLPTIEQIKIIYDSSSISKEGVLSFNGKALYNEVYNLYNGTWGYPNGSLTDFNVTVGSGSGIETWTHEFLDSQFANGESATFNMKLPQGISTSQKVNLKATYILNGTAADTTPANLVFSFLPVEVVNVLIADSDGNKEPTPRPIDGTTEFNTYTAQTSSVSSDIGENKVFQLPLGSFDISDYYEGDVVFMRLEKDSGTNVNFNLLSLDFEVSKWSLGKQSEPLELISETIFSEDFEDGGVSNGWTTVQNGTLTNLWAISDGTSRGGTNSAYITNDLGGTDVYSYTNGDDQDGAHLYADFTIPSNARSLTLKFYWTCIGENGGGENSYDFGRVGVSPTTYTPTQEIQFTSDYRVGAASNNNKFNVGYNGGATAGNWVEETIAIPNDLWVAGEDRRLLLYWQNDGFVGSQPPIAIDDITISIEYFN